MRTGTKMLMLTNNRSSSGGRNDYGSARMESGDSDVRNGYEGGSMAYGYAGGMEGNYGAESRFRDRRGREHYDNGRFAPMRSAMDDMDDMEDTYGPESRRRYRRYSDGRFAPHSAYDGGSMGGEMHSPSPFVPPIYEGGERQVNPIGFVPTGYWDNEPNYGMYADHKTMNEMENRSGQMQRGGASASGGKLTREMADEWMENLQNEDGSKGPHWTMDQTKQVMAQRGIKGEPLEFYVILNALYSDYCKVFQKHNINKIDLYADLASAWINDKDAMDGKAALYYECIVQK